MPIATPMFAADAALGRLARWLRLLGYDTTYERGLGDAQLIRSAAAEGRILLTRNTRLIRRRDVPPYVLIHDDAFRAQLRQVIDTCALHQPPALLARCSRCNRMLEPVEPAEAGAQVPAYVRATQTAFARCPGCARLYWPATHVERMRDELARMGLRAG